jgi:hypothetical protein
MKLKRQQIKLLTQQHKISMAEQFHMAWMKTQTQKCLSQEPRCHSSATTAQQLLDYTATACCIQRFNLSLSHLSPFGGNKVTTSICFTCLRKENYFRETQLCTHAYSL